MADPGKSIPFHDTPTIPPATPPVVNPKADPDEAHIAKPDGDSDFPGRTPDEEIIPGGDTDDPSISPREVEPGEEELDRPGQTPDETPPPPVTAPD